MQIKGEKIILRPMEEEDLELVFQWINNPDIKEYWYGRDKPRTMEWVKKHFLPAIRKEKKYSYWIIELNGDPIGYADVVPGEDDDEQFSGSIELDILIGDKRKWEQGYGSDALKSLQNYAFNTLGAERVFIVPRTINPRAIHVYEKVGFKKEGILRHNERFEGKWIDGVMMAIIRDQFRSQ